MSHLKIKSQNIVCRPADAPPECGGMRPDLQKDYSKILPFAFLQAGIHTLINLCCSHLPSRLLSVHLSKVYPGRSRKAIAEHPESNRDAGRDPAHLPLMICPHMSRGLEPPTCIQKKTPSRMSYTCLFFGSTASDRTLCPWF